jgi:hypothetical protein
LPNQNSERAAASASGTTHSNLITYANAYRPPPNPGKTSLFVRQNEVSPSKTEVFPGNSDYKNDFPPGENEVYPLESSLQNEVYPGEFRLGGQALRTATQCTMDLHQIQANFKHHVCWKTLKNNFEALRKPARAALNREDRTLAEWCLHYKTSFTCFGRSPLTPEKQSAAPIRSLRPSGSGS